jgi:Fe-S oxidoreductase
MKNFIKGIKDYFGNIYYYPGCLTRFALPEIEEDYIQILKRLDIDFITVPGQIICCGAPVLDAGCMDEFSEHKESVYTYLKSTSVSRIITSCPSCFGMLKNRYDLSTQHIVQILHDKKECLKPIFKGQKITYHDPCRLGRYEGLYTEPRAILEQMGFELVEMKDNMEKALCCGAGAGLARVRPKTSSKIAKSRCSQAIDSGAGQLVTCCPMCYLQLRDNAPKGLKIFELSQLVLKSLQ